CPLPSALPNARVIILWAARAPRSPPRRRRSATLTARAEAHRGWCPARTSNPLGAGGTRLWWVRFPHASASSSARPQLEGGPMKKLVVLIVVLVGLWVGVNYMRTGQFSLLPSAMSAEEQHVRDLESEIANINEQMAQAGRAAGMTGMDTTQDVSALMEKKSRLEKELIEARKRVH